MTDEGSDLGVATGRQVADLRAVLLEEGGVGAVGQEFGDRGFCLLPLLLLRQFVGLRPEALGLFLEGHGLEALDELGAMLQLWVGGGVRELGERGLCGARFAAVELEEWTNGGGLREFEFLEVRVGEFPDGNVAADGAVDDAVLDLAYGSKDASDARGLAPGEALRDGLEVGFQAVNVGPGSPEHGGQMLVVGGLCRVEESSCFVEPPGLDQWGGLGEERSQGGAGEAPVACILEGGDLPDSLFRLFDGLGNGQRASLLVKFSRLSQSSLVDQFRALCFQVIEVV